MLMVDSDLGHRVVWRLLTGGKGKGQGAQPNDKCHSCRQKGHWARSCPTQSENDKKKGKGNVNLTVDNLKDLGA